MSDQHSVPRRPRRFAPLLIVAGLASAIVLSLSMTNTFSAFTAAITNSNDTAATGTVILTETNPIGPVTCSSNSTAGAANGINTNTFSCGTINKYGGSTVLVPGSTNTLNLTFGNTGTASAVTFTLTAAACVPGTNGTVNGSAGDFCNQLQVLVKSGGTTIYSGSAAAMSTGTPAIATLPVPTVGGTVPIAVTISLPTTLNNTYQGLSASQALTWTLST